MGTRAVAAEDDGGASSDRGDGKMIENLEATKTNAELLLSGLM
jgi:hypothetical protein